MRTDALSFNTGAFFEPLEKHLHAIFGQGLARLGEKEVIFSSASPFVEFLFIRTMFIEIIGEVAQTVLSKCHTSLLRSFPHHRHDPVFAIKIRLTQVDEFGDADAGIIQEPEDSAIAYCS